MNKSVFPSLLSKRARIFASFSRSDVVLMGGAYLILSSFKVSILPMSLILISLYGFKIVILSKIEFNFFKNLIFPRELHYRGALRRVYVKR
jgi:hypothetical protein